MTIEAPETIWAVHWNTEGAVMNGAWADTIRHFGGGVEYLRADHVDALLKAERERVLQEAAKVAKKAWHDPICEADDRHIPHLILALISEDATDGQ